MWRGGDWRGRDKLFTEIFPGRTDVPKTLIFAKDDSHAEDIVKIVREEFGKGNDFCQKITYRSGGLPENLISAFRTSYNPRLAVTVDMIATGTDIKPLEALLFMRAVRSSFASWSSSACWSALPLAALLGGIVQLRVGVGDFHAGERKGDP